MTVNGEPLPQREQPRGGAPGGGTGTGGGGETPSDGSPGSDPPVGESDPPSPVAPRLSALALRGRTLSVRLSSAAAVRVQLARCTTRRHGRSRVTGCTTVTTIGATARVGGTLKLTVPKRLRAGSYRVTVRARGAGGTSAALVRTVTLKAR